MLGRIGSLLVFRRTLRLAWRLLKDRRVPLTTKLIVPGALLYAVFPVDLLPDFLPALGQLDDLTALLLSVLLFVRACPAALVREHLEEMSGRPRPSRGGDGRSGPVIDGKYEVLD